jgi:hypothetical protein
MNAGPFADSLFLPSFDVALFYVDVQETRTLLTWSLPRIGEAADWLDPAQRVPTLHSLSLEVHSSRLRSLATAICAGRIVAVHCTNFRSHGL